eukprot:scaffold220883_cov30-Tisochrysis_lutea.AAC.1
MKAGSGDASSGEKCCEGESRTGNTDLPPSELVGLIVSAFTRVFGRPSQPYLKNIDHKEHQVGIVERSLHCSHHALLQLVLGRGVDAGRVGVDELVVITVENAKDPMARRPRLCRHDGESLTDKRVHECRLAHVGHADDRDEAGAVGRGRCAREQRSRASPHAARHDCIANRAGEQAGEQQRREDSRHDERRATTRPTQPVLPTGCRVERSSRRALSSEL